MKPCSRREFIARCAVVTAASGLSTVNIRASDKTGNRELVTGSGEHTYSCIHDWLQPPEGMVWGDTHGLCQDANGFIYACHTVNRASMRGETVVVYDAAGKFVRAFGEEFRGGAHGLDLRQEGGEEILYHCDINRCRIVKTTLEGREVWSHGYPKEDPAYGRSPINFVPTNVAFAPNGDFFVADGYGSYHV